MSVHLRKEMEQLKKDILALGAFVEEHVRRAVRSIEERDGRLARRVIESDLKIDAAEVRIEEECLKILALHQPVAIDLRFLVAVLKINNDLERIGDLAVNIAERGVFLARQKAMDIPFDFAGMAEKTKTMLKKSLDALVNLDSALARQVCAADEEVDAINRRMYGQVKEGIRHRMEDMECLIHLLGVSRDLERVADLTTNIAEEVVYLREGEIIRHKTEEYGA